MDEKIYDFSLRDVLIPDELMKYYEIEMMLSNIHDFTDDDVIDFLLSKNFEIHNSLYILNLFCLSKSTFFTRYYKIFKDLLLKKKDNVKSEYLRRFICPKVSIMLIYECIYKYDELLINGDIDFLLLSSLITKQVDLISPNINFYIVDEVERDDFKLIKDLLEYGYPENSVGYYIMKDDIDSLISMIHNDLDVNAVVYFLNLRNYIYNTNALCVSLISIAAFHGSTRCFKYLISRNATIDDTTIYLSIIGANEDIIQILTNKGYDFGSHIEAAIKTHNFNIIEWILSNFNVSSAHFNPYISLQNFNIPCFVFLLNLMDDINASYTYDNNILFCSYIRDITAYLIAKGACVSKPNNIHCTPLHHFASLGDFSTCELLIQSGADKNKRNFRIYYDYMV